MGLAQDFQELIISVLWVSISSSENEGMQLEEDFSTSLLQSTCRGVVWSA